MNAADHLRYPIERLTYRALIGLLAVTGTFSFQVVPQDVTSSLTKEGDAFGATSGGRF